MYEEPEKCKKCGMALDLCKCCECSESSLNALLTSEVQVSRDMVAEKLDEMADIAEYWKKNREKGRMPNAIRAAMLMLARETLAIQEMEEQELAHKTEDLCGPAAYVKANVG